ncbi:uncharacterized protein METZ01_LOCUS292251, partial [marine metagenome]
DYQVLLTSVEHVLTQIEKTGQKLQISQDRSQKGQVFCTLTQPQFPAANISCSE